MVVEDWLIPIVAVFVGGAVTFGVEWWFRGEEREDAARVRRDERDQVDRIRSEDRRRVVYADASAALFTYLDQYNDLATGGKAGDPFSNAEANEVELRLRIDGSQSAWVGYQKAISAAQRFLGALGSLRAEERERDALDPRRPEEEHHADHVAANDRVEAAKQALHESLTQFEGEVREFRSLVMRELDVEKTLDGQRWTASRRTTT